MHDFGKQVSPTVLVLGLLGLFAFGIAAYAQVRIYSLSSELAATASTTSMVTTELEQKIVTLSDTLYVAQQNLEAVQERLGGFEDTVGDISGTVGTLEKLSKTDPELLQKYSKIYFLNENYVPERLEKIAQEWAYSDTRAEQIHTEVEPHLIELLEEAKDDSVTLYIKSAYRSFAEQKALKGGYTVVYGAGTANQFSAEQGYSEHQLGTAVDLTTTGLNGALDGFDKTPAYEWMLKNAYKYGFVLSYPQGNGFYVFEPWHWRYVGEKLARDLYRKEKHFYELEQRDIDEYLVNIFD